MRIELEREFLPRPPDVRDRLTVRPKKSDDPEIVAEELRLARREEKEHRTLITGYFAAYPSLYVHAVRELEAKYERGQLSPSKLSETYDELCDQYQELVDLTEWFFPNDVGLQAVSLRTVQQVSDKKLDRIEHNWNDALRKHDVLYGDIYLPLVGRAETLSQGIRDLREIALRADIELVEEELGFEEQDGMAAK